jgi:hypothetical protein
MTVPPRGPCARLGPPGPRMGYEQAVAAYRVALRGAHADRVAILIELGEAQLYTGDLDGARDTCAEAARLAQDAGRAEDLARAALGMGTGLGGSEVRLYDEHQIVLLEQALDLLPNADTALRAAVLARLSVAYSQLGQAEQQQRLARDAVTMADRAGDVRTQVAARGALCDALAGPDHIAERLGIAEQMLAFAEHIDDLPAILLARRLRLVALLEGGNFTAADAEIVAYTRTAERLMLPLYGWYVPIWRGMRALMCGDVPGAFRFADQAEEIGLRAGSHNANLMVFTLRVAAHRAQGTLADYAHEVTAVLRQLPEQTMPLAAGAAMLLDAGQPDQAANLLSRVMGMGLEAIPKDSEWLQAVWSVGCAAIALSNLEAAAQAAQYLAPYTDLWVVDGVGGAVFGLVAHILGQLRAMLGHHDAGEMLLGRALERHRAAGAALLVEQTQRAMTELQVIRQQHAVGPEVIEPPPSTASCAARDGCGPSAGASTPRPCRTPRGYGIWLSCLPGPDSQCTYLTWWRQPAGRRGAAPAAIEGRCSTAVREQPTGAGSPSWPKGSRRQNKTVTPLAWHPDVTSRNCSPRSWPRRTGSAGARGRWVTRWSGPGRRWRCASPPRSAQSVRSTQYWPAISTWRWPPAGFASTALSTR